MSASVWDRAVEAAMEALGGSFYDISPDRAETRHAARDTLAAALPVLLEELAQRIEAESFAYLDNGSLYEAAGIVRGFAAEVTQ